MTEQQPAPALIVFTGDDDGWSGYYQDRSGSGLRFPPGSTTAVLYNGDWPVNARRVVAAAIAAGVTWIISRKDTGAHVITDVRVHAGGRIWRHTWHGTHIVGAHVRALPKASETIARLVALAAAGQAPQ